MAMPENPIITDVAGGGQHFQAPIYTQEQAQIPSTLIQAGGQKLANPTEGFDPYAEYAQRLFKQNLVPGIANQFITGGNRNSSAFQGALGSASSDLAAQLGVARANYGLENERFGANLLGQAMTPLYNQSYERPYSASGDIGASLGQGLPALLKAYAEAPGKSFKDKMGSILGTVGDVADTVKGATTTGGDKASTTVPAALTAGTTAAAAGTAAATKAMGTTGTAATGTTGTVPPIAKAGVEAAIAPALAKAGAIVMPAVVGGLGLWILGTIAKSLYEDFTETGEYSKSKISKDA